MRALRNAPAQVLLLDRNNYHKFQPLLYQIATAGLTPDNITRPVRELLRGQENATFEQATVTGLDPEARRVEVEEGDPVPYDYLVLCPGAVTNYAGVEGAREHAFPLKDVPDAINLRNHVLARFEQAGRDEALRRPEALDVIVVGGGPTGVETAAMTAELFKDTMPRDFAWATGGTARVRLVNHGPHVMGAYPAPLRRYARRSLEERGVDVRLGKAVEAVTPGGVRLEDGTSLAAGTVVWAAGVRAHPLAGVIAEAFGLKQARGGRLPAGGDLRVEGQPRVFVAGDAGAASGEDGDAYPQLAPVALQQGGHAGRQVARLAGEQGTRAFRYRDLGKMATLGRGDGIGDLAGGLQLTGRLAWLAWAAVHVAKLPGLRNRLIATTNWLVNYFTHDRKARALVDGVPISGAAEREKRRLHAKLGAIRADDEASGEEAAPPAR